MLWLDEYERRARLVPGLLAIFPLAVLLSVLSLRQLSTISYVMSSVMLVGAPVVVADIVRQYGRKIEKELWINWGGPPTTTWLRLREPSENNIRRDLWRKAAAEVSGVNLLSLRAERSRPFKADQAIETATERVRDLTRDRERFDLLFQENRGYGYTRNLYGVRWIGRASSLTSCLVMGNHMAWLSIVRNQEWVTAENLFGLFVCFVFFMYWCIWPAEKRVREAANNYAHQLLQSAVTLHDDADSPRPSPSQ